MLQQSWKIAVCMLAVLPSLHAQQNGSKRLPKVGGIPLKQLAERISPQGRTGYRTSSNVDTSQAVAPAASASSSGRETPHRRIASPGADLSLASRRRDDAIAIAEKRVEFARQQLADLESYNRWVPPSAQTPMAVRALPYSMSYSPVRLAEPVQIVVPRSNFAHVQFAGERELRDAELQLATLVAERNSIGANNAAGGEVESTGDSSDNVANVALLEASLRRAQFMAESAEWRLTQLSNLSRLTYSGMYRNLYRKLELKRLEHELAAQSLEAERNELVSVGSGQ